MNVYHTPAPTRSPLEIFFSAVRFDNKYEASSLDEFKMSKSGLCGVHTEWFVRECRENGYKARRTVIRDIPYKGDGHTTAEAFIYDRWVFFDISTGIAFIDEDSGALMSWQAVVEYAKVNNQSPKLLIIEKTLYSTPSLTKLHPRFSCPSCATVVGENDGILERYYCAENLQNTTQYWKQEDDGSFSSYDVLTDEVIEKSLS